MEVAIGIEIEIEKKTIAFPTGAVGTIHDKHRKPETGNQKPGARSRGSLFRGVK